ncbi:hypothetical protein VTH06DRAFT_4843 [Thermothelomyces fergusii]
MKDARFSGLDGLLGLEIPCRSRPCHRGRSSYQQLSGGPSIDAAYTAGESGIRLMRWSDNKGKGAAAMSSLHNAVWVAAVPCSRRIEEKRQFEEAFQQWARQFSRQGPQRAEQDRARRGSEWGGGRPVRPPNFAASSARREEQPGEPSACCHSRG